MKSLRILLFSLACSLSLSAETPLLLSQAVDKLIADDEHWAYTRVTRPLTRDGKPSDSVTIEQFDPSLPYGHQWTLVKLNGHAPSRAEVQSWEASKARMTKARGNGRGRILGFIPVSMGREFSYADFRRVKPYRERFGVQIGDIKALDF